METTNFYNSLIMSADRPQNRLIKLSLLLRYCKETRDGYFTTGERICINQERGKLLALYDFDDCPAEYFGFNYPTALQKKVDFVIKKIENGWKPLT